VITQNSIDEFLARLASADATPGGGSAAAIMGAMGAALVSMVCNVSIGKKGYEAVDAEMRVVRTQSETLRLRLTAMVAEDVAAFDSLIDPDCPLTRWGIAVLTISDARDQTDDTSRDLLAERISSANHDLRARALGRDDKAASFYRKHFAICPTSNSKGSPYCVAWHAEPRGESDRSRTEPPSRSSSRESVP
jgi:hypothetical protein